MLKKIAAAILIILTFFSSVAFAAQTNSLDVLGIAFISVYESESLPIFPLVNAQGSYFSSNNLPAALTHGEEEWVGDTFYLNIVKPPTVGNNGQNMFTMTFDLMNSTNHTWTSGTASARIVSGIYSDVGATLSSTTVNPGQRLTVTFSFKTKIDIASYDEARITVSFIMAGERRYVYMNIIMRPV